MRTTLFLFFFALAGCSNNNGGTDAGPDAQSDVTAADSPSDVATNDVATDTGGCNVTASGTITGTFLGNTLTPKDALSNQSKVGSQYEVIVAIADFTGVCALGNDTKASSNVLSFVYSDTTPLAAATLDLSKTNVLSVQYAQFNATCQSSQGESASSGTVTFTKVDSCGIVGTFDLTFNTDHVTGSFSAPTCGNVADGGAGTCK